MNKDSCSGSVFALRLYLSRSAHCYVSEKWLATTASAECLAADKVSDNRLRNIISYPQRTTVVSQLLMCGSMLALTVVFQQVHGQSLVDLDSDGIVDIIDIDQDNDGIVNALEGVARITDLSDSPAHRYVVNPDDSNFRGSSFIYGLVSIENGHHATLVGTVLSTDTEVEWSMHDALPRLRNLSSGSTAVQWTISGEESVRSIDLTISDLDGLRSESISVGINSIVGYSLALNTNILVRSDNSRLIFIGTGAGGDSIDDLVTLHFRDLASMVIEYSNGLPIIDGVNQSDILNSETGIAGYRHSLEFSSSTFFTPVTNYRDTDADGIADHRDLDSDNDGLGDVIESGGIDANHDNLSDGAADAHGLPDSAIPGLSAESVTAVYSAENTVFGDDTDGDGLLSSIDGMPGTFGGARSGVDTDNDGLDDLDEIRLYHTSPNQEDSDNDGLTDKAEVERHNTSPLQSDTDRDGLSDGEEINDFGTIPTNADSDGDGIVDSDEIKNGTDPLISDKLVVVRPDPIPAVPAPDDLALEPVSDTTEVIEVLDEMPESAVLLADEPAQASTGTSLRTGLGGIVGCSVVDSNGLQAPLLPMMLVLAIAGLGRKAKANTWITKNRYGNTRV